MQALTPAERRGGLILVALLALGALRDLGEVAFLGGAPDRRVHGEDAVEESQAGASSLAPHAESDVPAGPSLGDSTAEAGGRLDLNRATAEELERLPGIGPVLAARIVEHRRRHGPWASVAELRAVRGIGPRLMERLAPHLTVSSPQTPPRDVHSARRPAAEYADSASGRIAPAR